MTLKERTTILSQSNTLLNQHQIRRDAEPAEPSGESTPPQQASAPAAASPGDVAADTAAIGDPKPLAKLGSAQPEALTATGTAMANGSNPAAVAGDGGTGSSPNGAARRERRVRVNPASRRLRRPDDSVVEQDGEQPAAGDAVIGPPVPVPAGTAETAEPATSGAGEPSGAAPAKIRTANRTARRSSRLQRREAAKAERQEQAQEKSDSLPAITYEDGQAAYIAMIRHINSLTVSLAEAHRMIGRLNMERHMFERQLAEAKGLPLPPPLPAPTWQRSEKSAEKTASRQHASEARAVRRVQRVRTRKEERDTPPDPEEVERHKAIGRRRRAYFAIGAAILAAMIVGYRMTGWNWFPDISSRDSLAQIAAIGPFVQILLVGWLVYRVARVSGKGARWLFPSPEPSKKRRR